MIGKKTVTWVVLADGARARIIAQDGPGAELTSIYEEEDVKGKASGPRDRG